MGGGLMQLVAYGAQDVYLTGNPQITFFKVVYRRHTNFAVEPIQQVWNGTPDFGRTVTATINRNGDLITNMYSVVQLSGGDVTGSPDEDIAWAYVRRLGYAMIAETKVEIGGSKIDEQYGDWLNIWYELTHKVGQERGHGIMIGDSESFQKFSTYHDAAYLYIPLTYWFNRFNGLALPLIALQYHDVRVTIQYATLDSCINSQAYEGINGSSTGVGMDDNYLLIDYVYLDSEERKRFAQASHEYLIEQLQFTGSESLTSTTTNKFRLNFNHPSKYLIWAAHLDSNVNSNDYLAYSATSDWSAALDLAAKLIWLQSRTGLNLTSGVWSVPRTTTTEERSSYNTNLTLVPYWNNISGLPSLVDAQFLFDISGGTTYTAAPSNVVITRNDLTIADISVTIQDLISGFTGSAFTGTGTTFLTAGLGLTSGGVDTFNIQDQFNYGVYLDRSQNPVSTAKLQLNGHDRFQERDGNYFNYVQPYQHFSNTPSDGVNVYSFALKPEDHQPSGTCNFSRIDNATLNLSLIGPNSTPAFAADTIYLGSDSTLNIYTVNYNVLRVMSGMAGTAYSN